MDRTLGAGEGGNRAAGALRDDLRHDGDRCLLGRVGPEIETDRRSEAIKAGLVDTGVDEAFGSVVVGSTAPITPM